MLKIVLISVIILLQIKTIISVSKTELVYNKATPKMSSVSTTLAPGVAPAGMVHIRVVSRHTTGAAGGDVILGGLAVAVVAAVVCYIRATRKPVIHQPGALQY